MEAAPESKAKAKRKARGRGKNGDDDVGSLTEEDDLPIPSSSVTLEPAAEDHPDPPIPPDEWNRDEPTWIYPSEYDLAETGYTELEDSLNSITSKPDDSWMRAPEKGGRFVWEFRESDVVDPVEKARLRIMDEMDNDSELQAQLRAASKSLAVFMRGRS